MREKNRMCEDCGINAVEFPDERECAWCMARHRKEEDK